MRELRSGPPDYILLIVSGGPSGNQKFGLPERGEPGHPVLALSTALERYEAGRSARSLDVAFAAAAAAVADLRGARASAPPDVSELRSLFEQLPDYERLVEVAVSETERSVRSAGARLWSWFGLESDAAALERRRAGASAAARGVRVRAAGRARRAVAGAAAAQAGGGPVGRAAHR